MFGSNAHFFVNTRWHYDRKSGLNCQCLVKAWHNKKTKGYPRKVKISWLSKTSIDGAHTQYIDFVLQMISRMFYELREATLTRMVSKLTGLYVTMKPKTTTVSASFHESLVALMETMARFVVLLFGFIIFSFFHFFTPWPRDIVVMCVFICLSVHHSSLWTTVYPSATLYMSNHWYQSLMSKIKKTLSWSVFQEACKIELLFLGICQDVLRAWDYQ